MNKVAGITLFVLLLLFSISCSFQKVLKKGDVDKKYELAQKLYEEKDYSRALQLYDQLMGVMRATDKTQKIYYNYAYSYYYQKEYTLAAYYFKRYATNFPNTTEAEECAFMSAKCNYLNSPTYTLDQSSTYEAIKDLQQFTNTYPTSPRVSECNDLIDELRAKLELKDYKIAKMYFRMEDYTAAITCFNNILKDFPESTHKEEILYLILDSYEKYASKSIEDKKKERYKKVLVAYNDLATLYPDSHFLEMANEIKEKSQKEIELLNDKDNKPQK